jgi:hypothetical protein
MGEGVTDAIEICGADKVGGLAGVTGWQATRTTKTSEAVLWMNR